MITFFAGDTRTKLRSKLGRKGERSVEGDFFLTSDEDVGCEEEGKDAAHEDPLRRRRRLRSRRRGGIGLGAGGHRGGTGRQGRAHVWDGDAGGGKTAASLRAEGMTVHLTLLPLLLENYTASLKLISKILFIYFYA